MLNNLPGNTEQINGEDIDPSLSLIPSTGLQSCFSDFRFGSFFGWNLCSSNVFHLTNQHKVLSTDWAYMSIIKTKIYTTISFAWSIYHTDYQPYAVIKTTLLRTKHVQFTKMGLSVNFCQKQIPDDTQEISSSSILGVIFHEPKTAELERMLHWGGRWAATQTLWGWW